MSQQSISGCRVWETLHNLCSPFINPPPPCYYLRTIPYSLLNPCLQDRCHGERHSAALHIPQLLTPADTSGSACRLRRAHMHTNAPPQKKLSGRKAPKQLKGSTPPDLCPLERLQKNTRTQATTASTAREEVAGEERRLR